VAVHHAVKKRTNLTPRSNNDIQAGDEIAVVGKEKNVRKMAEELGWTLKAGLETFADSLARTTAGMAETVVSPRSELIGKTMNQIKFKELYNLNPVALFKGNRIYYTGLSQIALAMGDTLLLHGPWERFHLLKNQPQPRVLTFATPLEGEILRPQKAKLAVFWLALSLLQIIAFKIQLSVVGAAF
jgi:uncharacterized transporter YbjL